MTTRERPTPVSSIAQAFPDRVEVRGRDLTRELMGRLTFTEYFHLLVTGREPTPVDRHSVRLACPHALLGIRDRPHR